MVRRFLSILLIIVLLLTAVPLTVSAEAVDYPLFEGTLRISDEGIESKVISSLPSGMETTLSLGVGSVTLSAVAFGSVDFAMDSIVKFNFEGDRYVLFDKESEQNLSLGSLEIVE